VQREGAPAADAIAAAARQLVRRYAWRLITEPGLVARVARRMQAPEPLPPDPAILCEQEAGAELFAACERGGLRSATAHERQQQEWAYHDLGNYLFTLAPRLPPPAPGVAWADLVQETLIEVHQRYPTCRQPSAFLGWAVAILKHKGAGTWRTARPTDPLPGDDEEAAAAPRAHQADPAGDQDVLRLLHECLDSDEERLRALWPFLGLKRREWALVFDAPLARFDQLGVAVKRKLLRCPAFLAWAGQPGAAA
jgi:DNA-directed RNA polymerase specialized sigma24 family protein